MKRTNKMNPARSKDKPGSKNLVVTIEVMRSRHLTVGDGLLMGLVNQNKLGLQTPEHANSDSIKPITFKKLFILSVNV